MVNIDFLVVSYIVGLFVDWIFQWSWQAEHKSKWNKEDNKWHSFVAVTTHSIVYAALTTAITLFLLKDFSSGFTVFVVLLVTHALIDTRIPVKLIMRLKGMTNEQIHDYINYGFMHIGIDHRLHELVLLILALYMKRY